MRRPTTTAAARVCLRKVMHAMDLMKQYGLIYGTSICYTQQELQGGYLR